MKNKIGGRNAEKELKTNYAKVIDFKIPVDDKSEYEFAKWAFKMDAIDIAMMDRIDPMKGELIKEFLLEWYDDCFRRNLNNDIGFVGVSLSLEFLSVNLVERMSAIRLYKYIKYNIVIPVSQNFRKYKRAHDKGDKTYPIETQPFLGFDDALEIPSNQSFALYDDILPQRKEEDIHTKIDYINCIKKTGKPEYEEFARLILTEGLSYNKSFNRMNIPKSKRDTFMRHLRRDFDYFVLQDEDIKKSVRNY